MKIAVVGTNSFFRAGTSSFMMHLVYGNKDWDLLLFNEKGSPIKRYDIPTDDIRVNYTYIKDADAKILQQYDLVLFATPRWNGNYNFLDNITLKKVGIIIHDHKDFSRMGINDLMKLYPNAILFCLDSVVKNIVSKAIRIDQPFDGKMLPFVQGEMIDNGISIQRDRFICTSRFSSSKHPEDVAISVDSRYPLYFYGVNRETFNIETYGGLFKTLNIYLYEKPYTQRGIAEAYTKAIGVIDASDFEANYDRVQYTILEAWWYGCIPLIKKGFFSNETIDKVTCLELTKDNVKLAWENFSSLQNIVENGQAMLARHSPKIVRDEIMANF